MRTGISVGCVEAAANTSRTARQAKSNSGAGRTKYTVLPLAPKYTILLYFASFELVNSDQNEMKDFRLVYRTRAYRILRDYELSSVRAKSGEVWLVLGVLVVDLTPGSKRRSPIQSTRTKTYGTKQPVYCSNGIGDEPLDMSLLTHQKARTEFLWRYVCQTEINTYIRHY